MAPLCGRRLAVLEQTIGIAAILDVVVMQPVFVAAVYLWRWLATDELDGRAVHDLHPVEGEPVRLEEDNDDGNADLFEDALDAVGDKYAMSEEDGTASNASDDVIPVGLDIEIEDL
jgi:hypothetical protein